MDSGYIRNNGTGTQSVLDTIIELRVDGVTNPINTLILNLPWHHRRSRKILELAFKMFTLLLSNSVSKCRATDEKSRDEVCTVCYNDLTKINMRLSGRFVNMY